MEYPYTIRWKETLETGVLAGIEVDKGFGCFNTLEDRRFADRLRAKPNVRAVELERT